MRTADQISHVRPTAPAGGPAGASRRDFLRLSAAGATLLGLGVPGCTSAVDRERTGGSRAGGELVIAQSADIVPKQVINQSGMNATWRRAVFDTLIDIDRRTRKTRPGLATEWQTSSDGKVTTFTLREGVKWHSGRAFDARDVTYTLEFLRDKPQPPWAFIWLAKRLSAVEAVDSKTVRVAFDEPVANLFDALSLMLLLDRESADDLLAGTAIVGTGPYRWGEYQQGTSLRLRRNASYWQDKSAIDSLLIRVISRPEARMAAVRSGQVHMATAVSPLDLKQVEKDDRFTITEYSTFSSGVYLGSNVKVRPLDNRQVRQAIQYAVDRERINEELYRGRARVNATPWSETSPAYDRELAAAYPRDVARAKRMLAAAGASGREIVLEANQALSKIAEIVEFNLREAGLKPTLRVLNTAQQEERVKHSSFGGLWIGQHGYNTLSPTTLLYSAAPYRPTGNLFNFSSRRYGTLAEDTLRPGSDEEKAASYRALSQFLLDEAFCCDLVHATNTAVTRGLSGWDHSIWDDLVLSRAGLG